MGTPIAANRPLRVVIVCGLTLGAGCRRATPPAVQSQPVAVTTTQPVTLQTAGKTPAPAPQTAPVAVAEKVFESQKVGLRLHYPGDWTQKKSSEDALLLTPADGAADRSITLDVPNVPLHLPGAMTMPLIENGFVDDLRKHHRGLKVEEARDETLAHGKARFVRSTWKDNGKDYTDAALLIVHADKVYILSLDTDLPGYESTHAVMEKMAQSIEWLK